MWSCFQSEVGWEEYYDYIFPDDQTVQPNIKLLSLAKQWKTPGAMGEQNSDDRDDSNSSSSEEESSDDDGDDDKKDSEQKQVSDGSDSGADWQVVN